MNQKQENCHHQRDRLPMDPHLLCTNPPLPPTNLPLPPIRLPLILKLNCPLNPTNSNMVLLINTLEPTSKLLRTKMRRVPSLVSGFQFLALLAARYSVRRSRNHNFSYMGLRIDALICSELEFRVPYGSQSNLKHIQWQLVRNQQSPLNTSTKHEH